jgi:DNA gyrase subunit B
VEGESAEGVFESDRLRELMAVLDQMEHTLTILERRGLSIPALLARLKNGVLPGYRVTLGSQEHWFFTDAEVDAFRQEQTAAGRHLLVADDNVRGTNGNGNGHGEVFSVQELHEIKAVNRGLEQLGRLGRRPGDLIPAPRIAGRDPVPRFFLASDGKETELPQLRVLVAEIRKLGEKGIKVTRFKGLGEMDGDELWETTLDPAKRTLLKVQLDEASELAIEEMFRTLMGEKVEPRREFIQKHALEAKDIDYHGA